MKSVFIVTLTFLSLILYGQNDMNEQLSKLFLFLDLTSSPKEMVAKSSLKFEYGINRGINYRNKNDNTTSNDTFTFGTSFTKNPLIESKIKEGQISILQQSVEVKSGHFTIHEKIEFLNEDDMIKEYYNMCSIFEKLGYRVKNIIIQNDDFKTKSENTEILMETNSNKSTLTIGYYLPPDYEEDKEYFLAFVYTNH